MGDSADELGLHHDLRSWQASSHPELNEVRPEDLFEAEFVERYHRLHADLWQRIIRLHGTLLTLEQLREFPFDYLYPPGRMEFWRLVIENFLDTAVLLLHGLVRDQGSDVHSLISFRGALFQASWKCAEKRDLLRRTLRERKFDDAIQSIAEKVDRIRDNRVAHSLVDKQTGAPKDSLAYLSLEELWQLIAATQGLFGAISIGSTYVTLAGDLTPGTIGGRARGTCLDGVFDAVLRQSEFVNQPELEAPFWIHLREYMNDGRLEVMNKLRRRIGLPPA